MDRLRDLTRRRPVLVLMHAQSDPDALASAHLLLKAFGEGDIGTFSEMGHNAKRIAEELDIPVIIGPRPDDYKVIAAVDAVSPEMLSPDVEITPDLVVDHHLPHGSWDGALSFVEEDRPSCVEIVIDLLDGLGIALDRRDALIALTGMIADTARFRFANARTLMTAARLLEEGVDMSEVLAVVESEHYFDVSRRIAHLKALQRVEVRRAGDMLIASTSVSAFEGSAARILLQAGADVALVMSAKRNDGGRISGRAGPRAVARGVHLGRAMQSLAESMGGWGGGHAGAAGMSVPGGRLEEALVACGSRIAEQVSERGGNEDVDDVA